MTTTGQHEEIDSDNQKVIDLMDRIYHESGWTINYHGLNFVPDYENKIVDIYSRADKGLE